MASRSLHQESDPKNPAEIVPLGAEGTGGRYFFLPAGLEIEAALGEDLSRHADCARYFVHRIVFRQLNDRRFHGERRLKFVPINAAEMRKFFPGPRPYTRVLNRLIDSGVVIKSPSGYVPGMESTGYCLKPELSTRRIEMVAITDPRLQGKIRSANKAKALRYSVGFRSELAAWVQRLEIDYDAAMETLESEKYDNRNECSVAMIRNRAWFILERDPYGRFHSNLTNLPSAVRKHLTCRGEPLVNLDIRNSQPLLFSWFLREKYGQGEMPADVLHYIDLVQNGGFYEYLMREGGTDAIRRRTFKDRFFRHVFFCNTRQSHEYQPVVKVLFEEHFPNVYDLVCEMKAPANWPHGQNPPAYAKLAHQLQRSESDLMIERIALRCLRELPGAPVLTIHDSVMTTPDEAEPIRRIMLEEFRKKGLYPTIQIEDYGRGIA